MKTRKRRRKRGGNGDGWLDYQSFHYLCDGDGVKEHDNVLVREKSSSVIKQVKFVKDDSWLTSYVFTFKEKAGGYVKYSGKGGEIELVEFYHLGKSEAPQPGGGKRKRRKPGKTRKKRKIFKSKSKITKRKSKTFKNKVWSRHGFVRNPKTKRYVRIGSNKSFNIIKNHLVRNKEWKKRVKYMIRQGGKFGDKLKN